MNGRRLACFVLGAWLAACLTAGLAYSYCAGERQRQLLADWTNLQAALAAAMFCWLLFLTRVGRLTLGVSLGVLALAVLQRAAIVPEIESLGRLAETAGPVAEGAGARLWVLEKAYFGVDALKGSIGLAAAGRLVFNRWFRSRYARQEIDLVDEADHSHVDR